MIFILFSNKQLYPQFLFYVWSICEHHNTFGHYDRVRVANGETVEQWRNCAIKYNLYFGTI